MSTRASNNSAQHIGRQTKKERAFIQIIKYTQGITENDLLIHSHVSSGRNYVTELERKLAITFHRVKIPNPDGIGGHFSYQLTCQTDAEKVLRHINRMLLRKGRKELPPELASAYPSAPCH